MKVVVYSVKDLPEVLQQEPFVSGGQIPISPLRAQAHFHNPRADKSDMVLWCMFDKEKLIAYRLVLPGSLNIDGAAFKMTWLSCLWVDKDHRGKGYGKKLTRLALAHWKNRIAFANAAPASLSLYSNMDGCDVLFDNVGMRYYFSSELATILPTKFSLFKSVDFLLKPIDSVVNSLLRFNNIEDEKRVDFELLEKISEETGAFISKHNSENLSQWGKQDFDWLIEHPWVIESSEPNPDVERYHFSIQHPVYRDYYIQVKDGDKIIGLVLLKNKNNHFTVHYIWGEKPGKEKLAHSILYIMSKHRPKTLSIYDEELIQILDNISFKYLYKKITRQRFMAYSGIPTVNTQNKNLFQYGDADSVFT